MKRTLVSYRFYKKVTEKATSQRNWCVYQDYRICDIQISIVFLYTSSKEPKLNWKKYNITKSTKYLKINVIKVVLASILKTEGTVKRN